AAVNGLVVVVALLPIRGLGTRAGQIREVLRDGTLTSPVHSRLLHLEVLRDLGGAVVDAPGYHASLLDAAAAWVELGDAEQAEALCAEAETLPGDRSPFARALAALTRGQVAAAAWVELGDA